MIGEKNTRAAQIRKDIGHPVIDADGHIIETSPVFKAFFLQYVTELGGANMAARFENSAGLDYDDTVLRPWSKLSEQQRRDMWLPRPPWWTVPTGSTLDRATSHIPRLMYERLPDFGIDFAILYPSRALTTTSIPEAELRQVACRAFNAFNAEVYAPYADRMTCVAQIPMHTPEEALEALEHAVGELGFKAIMINGLVHRPVKTSSDGTDDKDLPNWGGGASTRIDALGLDSEYNYDPFWQRCIDLGVSPASHSPGMGWGARRSVSNYQFNHIGSFAASMDTSCKSLFMGGVTTRFPDLAIGLLEGGVAWASMLLADILGHWSKRNMNSIQHLNPQNLDRELLRKMFEEYGEGRFAENIDGMINSITQLEPEPPELDEWAPLEGAQTRQDLIDRFVPNFYFGCEADDTGVALAFNPALNEGGARIKAMFSSDMGHWDVPDMEAMLCEAYELIEDELINEDDFKDFTFRYPAEFYSKQNPNFFEGTSIEQDVKKVLAG